MQPHAQTDRALQQYREYYDPPNFAECEQVWAAFGFQRRGCFVDVGANDPRRNSLTFPLEAMGWRGVLVEPLRACYERLVAERRGARVVHCACVAPGQTGKVTLYATHPECVAATVQKHVDEFNIAYRHTETCEARTLDEVLDEVKVPRVDLLSLDTEGNELDVLRGLDLERHRPRLILVEDKLYHLDKHRYLLARGYRLVRRTMLNNWYVRPDEHELRIRAALAERIGLWKKMLPIGVFFRRRRRERERREAARGAPR
jgi:FkbM family methyltransferase